MPTIPVVTPLGYLGVFFLITGFFLVIAGLGILQIEKITVQPGKNTWRLGLIIAVVGLLFLTPDIFNTFTPTNTIITPTISSTNTISLISETTAPVVSTSTIPATNTSVPTSTPTIVATNTFVPTDTPVPNLEPISGVWKGMDEGTVNGNPVSAREIELTLLADCSIGSICGTSSTLVDGYLCVKNLVWSGTKDETFIFEGTMKEGSASFCGAGGEITLTLMPNGTLFYTLEASNSSGSQVSKTANLNVR